VCAEGLALLIVMNAAWLGAHEFVGTFGATGELESCGSVWGLANSSDLNAASCQGDLRDRLTLVGGLIGLGAAVALIAPLTLRGASKKSSPGRRFGVLLALTISIMISMVTIGVGRHLMWSVSGG
jgi:hypothetical protein